MGTDHAPWNEIEGAVLALEESDPDVEIVLVGDEESVLNGLEACPEKIRARLSVVHAPNRISPGDAPAASVRRKSDSSIVVGVKLQKAGKVDAFVSAGSTGAVMAASLLFLRPLQGVDRPPVGTLLPTAEGSTLLVDGGANVDSKPKHLVQFARLGQIYAQDLMGIPQPRIGLLNIGSEPEKGNELAVEAYKLLERTALNFVGNVEGREIIRGGCDVLVCDGFSGNLLLKFYESVAGFVIGLLRKEMAAHHAKELDLDEIFRVLDYEEYGGAPLLGVNGVSIIMHGESPPKAICNAVGVAAQAVRSSMVDHMARELSGATPS
jgi:glycerol-3-phosphate acyltransferase PlsX